MRQRAPGQAGYRAALQGMDQSAWRPLHVACCLIISSRMTFSVGSPRFIGICLALIGPGVIAWLSDRFGGGSESVAVHATWLLAFVGLVVTVAAIAFYAEGLSWSQVGLRRPSWITLLRAVALALFFVFVFGPLASLALGKLGLQSFDAGRSKLAGLPTWYLVVAIVVVAASEE